MQAELDGTFDFCESCSQHNNCCVRMRHGKGQVASPPLLPHEAGLIASVSKIEISEFAEDTTPPGNGLAIRANGDRCYFYRDGKCAIYSARPLDCRIFPFDIREVDGGLFWIVYTDLCPTSFDFRRHFASAKHVLAKSNVSRADLIAFTKHGHVVMAPHSFRLLEEVVVPREASTQA